MRGRWRARRLGEREREGGVVLAGADHRVRHLRGGGAAIARAYAALLSLAWSRCRLWTEGAQGLVGDRSAGCGGGEGWACRRPRGENLSFIFNGAEVARGRAREGAGELVRTRKPGKAVVREPVRPTVRHHRRPSPAADLSPCPLQPAESAPREHTTSSARPDSVEPAPRLRAGRGFRRMIR